MGVVFGGESEVREGQRVWVYMWGVYLGEKE